MCHLQVASRFISASASVLSALCRETIANEALLVSRYRVNVPYLTSGA
jgi:hypothetical protein